MMEIRVYAADVSRLEDREIYNYLYGQVSAERRKKVDRMRFDRDKRLSLGAGVLLEAALRARGISDLTMTSERNKKPCLATGKDVHFNISHSGTRVMCAVSDREIGCDMEKVAGIDMDLARRFFYSEEYEALMKCRDQDSRTDLFFRYWTLKESFMKATGLGFELPLDQFCIILEDSGISVRQNVDPGAWYFKEFAPGDGYRYAVCSADRPVDEVRLTWIFFDRPGDLSDQFL